MSNVLTLVALALSLGSAPGEQTGALTAKADKMQPQVLISILPAADLSTQMASPAGVIPHKSEVSRGGPVAVVVLTKDCEKNTTGHCTVNADIIVYRPDGSIHQQAKALGLPAGRGLLALTFDAQAPSGVYRVVATIRDMTARRFATAEQKFGLTPITR